uniref:Uncharacterized protein n=1 Tax=Cannabis sativa TaxID=3483 RepID=A0A803QE51_CANSA
MANMEQPSSPMTRFGPQYYAGETGPRIGEQTIGEPYIDLGEDLELAKVREVVCQVSETKEPSAVGCYAFAQQRCKFLRWMDGQEYILPSHQAEVDHHNKEASDLVRQFNERTARGGGQALPRRFGGENSKTLETIGLGCQLGISGTIVPLLGKPLANQHLSGAPLAGQQGELPSQSFQEEAPPSCQVRMGGQALPSIGLVNHEQLPSSGMGGLEHTLSQGMVDQALANLGLQLNKPSPYSNRSFCASTVETCSRAWLAQNHKTLI